MASRQKDTLLYEETYRKGDMMVSRGCLPVLRHIAAGFEVESCELRRAGRLRRADGTEVEYQDLRVVLAETLNDKEDVR